ncbi:hypothetical protein [uncultured Parabacteroides sp.]|uniref:hypothetical protein n=2 Tax=uncultured Parabacteroides sp. TaxID=512312 RepID=UPI002657FC48|nr:hypothetical protein [uncultured Parabacteroides sp.]
MSSKKGAFVYQQIELTSAEWATNTTLYPASTWLFERLESGKFNMKLADGVHTFAELATVMQDITVTVKTNNATTYILTITTAAGSFDTPNLRGKDAPAPSIDPETKHWKIGEEDTGVVAEGKNGISVSVVENSENTETVYKLDITDKDGKKTTPNLRGTDAPIPSIDPVTKQWKIGDKDTGVVAEGKNAAITDDAPSDGKTYGRNNGAWSEIVESNQYLDLVTLFPDESGTLSDENYQKVVDAWENRVSLARISDTYTPMLIEKDEGVYNIGENTIVATFFGMMVSGMSITINTDKTYVTSSNYVRLNNNGAGTKYLSDNGEYLTPPTATPTTAGYMSAEDKKRVDDAVVFKDVTVATTLTGLSIANYSIKVTLSSASALSFASTPYEGWECMIDIKNNGSSDITQALPNATGWQCDETSMTIAAGKIASISVRYVHGTYVVLTKGN